MTIARTYSSCLHVLDDPGDGSVPSIKYIDQVAVAMLAVFLRYEPKTGQNIIVSRIDSARRTSPDAYRRSGPARLRLLIGPHIAEGAGPCSPRSTASTDLGRLSDHSAEFRFMCFVELS